MRMRRLSRPTKSKTNIPQRLSNTKKNSMKPGPQRTRNRLISDNLKGQRRDKQGTTKGQAMAIVRDKKGGLYIYITLLSLTASPALSLTDRTGKRQKELAQMAKDNFYSSRPWKELRRKALARAGYRCEWCGVSVRGKGASRVDHIRPRKQYPQLALAISNLRVLCPGCDNKRHAEKGRGMVEKSETGADGFPIDEAAEWYRNA